MNPRIIGVVIGAAASLLFMTKPASGFRWRICISGARGGQQSGRREIERPRLSRPVRGLRQEPEEKLLLFQHGLFRRHAQRGERAGHLHRLLGGA